MKNSRLTLVLVAVILMLSSLISCNKKTTEPDIPDIETIVAEETVVLPDATANSIINISDTQIVFPSDTSSDIYQAGSIIVSAPTELAPYGILRKVESHSIQGNQIVVNTAPARLEDAFEQMDLKIRQDMKTSDIEFSQALIKGVVFRKDAKNPYIFSYEIDEDFELSNNVVLNINGDLDLNLGYELSAKSSLLKGLYYLKSDSFITSNGELELSVIGSFEYERNIELYEHYFSPAIFFLGAVPIVVVPKVTIILTIDASGEASVTTSVSASASIKAGATFEKPEWSTYHEETLDFDYNPPELSASMDAKVSAGPRFEINLYGIAGPHAYGRPWLNLNADISSTPWWTLKGGFSVDVGVKFEALGYVADFSVENLINYSKIIAQAGQNQVATPTFNPAGGTYSSSQNVSISTTTPNAVIRYTTDGSNPTESSARYNSPIPVNTTTTIKAKAFRSGWTPSSVVSATYTINPSGTVATPIFNPAGGTYNSAQNVSLSCTTPGATIRYTTNGSDPTESSAIYSSPINVSSTTTIKARAFRSGWTPSSIANATYTINPGETVATPTFSPPAGTYSSAQNVSIFCNTSGATIRYTTNGSDPTESSAIYSSPINVSSTTTIKARAFRSGWTPSSIASALYMFGGGTPGEMVFVEGGTFHNGTSDVTLSSFYISKYETTQSEYQAVMGTNPSYFGGNPNHPVELVFWFNAIEYCNRRSMQEGLTPCYSYGTYGSNPSNWPSGWNTSNQNHTNVSCDWTANGYRLPTEMEWMYAAKGGNQSQGYTYSGSNNIDEVAWYDSNSGRTTHTVGTKLPNELGIYDMSGNVLEWCWDIHGDYPSGAQINPHGVSSGSYRVLRGGSWSFDAYYCSVSFRDLSNAADSYSNIGFRCVRVSP